MSTSFPFIQSIHINKVRHLQNINIQIDESRCRHLIITGQNGSGKTSLLRFLRDYLEGVADKQLVTLESTKQALQELQTRQVECEKHLSDATTTEEIAKRQGHVTSNRRMIENLKTIIDKFSLINLGVSNLLELTDSYSKGEFLISFFEAKRDAKIQPVSGAQRLDLPTINPITVNPTAWVGSRFLQFLVNQENRIALLLRKGDQAGAKEIQNWQNNITALFRDLFQNPQLTLEYDIDRFDFTINMPGREPFRLVDNQLSDGFSAAIQIIAELLLRMEAVTVGRYDMPGIVLIDEIETHLHIALQKNILPLLTGFFPNIQFIVTTHSPFVLNSLSDTVIFDLETQRRWENLSPMSASAVIENYFEQDLYSHDITRKVYRYAELIKSVPLTADQSQELVQISTELDTIDFESAPELVAYYRSLRTGGKATR